MEIESINPFIESVTEVFGNMLETDINIDNAGDESVIDGVGELINIIAGNAKAKYTGHKINISLPTVVRGKVYNISKTDNTILSRVPFESVLGHFSLMVTFKPTIVPLKETADESTGGR